MTQGTSDAPSHDEPRLSIVIPMLNESANLPALFSRLFPVLDGLSIPFEVIAIDDGSRDATLSMLQAKAAERPELKVLSFARNFGQHAGVMAGFEASRGEWVITLDADLQNPPEEIPKLVEVLASGHDLINTIRQGRIDSWFRKTASRIVNATARNMSGIHLNDFGCMLRGYHRDVVQAMIRRREFKTFIPALAMLYARRPIEIPVEHSARAEGVSNYSLWKLFSLQLDLITSFSLAPLRLLFTLGGVIAALGFGFGFFLVLARVVLGSGWAVEGVFTLFAILFMFIGAQFVAFGLLGEYIGRIYQEVRERPTYLLQDLEHRAATVAETATDKSVDAPAGEPAEQGELAQAERSS